MALVLANRVQETTTTTGTGTITLAGAVSGYQSFAVIGNGNTTYYTITSGTAWEVGIGTYTLLGTTLARTTILSSSIGGGAITLAGTSNVFADYPAERAVAFDSAGNSNLLGVNNIDYGYSTTATAAGTTTLTVASPYYIYFTGSTTQTLVMPVTSTLALGWSYHIANNSTGNITVNSSGGNLIGTILPGTTFHITCIDTGVTTAAGWDFGFTDFGTVTGTGSVVLSASPTLTGTVSIANTLAAALGSAAAPSYTFTGDTNTGIFSPGADTIAFAEGGAEVMRIDASGNVMIGTTTSPTVSRLYINSTEARIQSRNSTSGANGYSGSLATNEYRGAWAITNTVVTFGNNDTERMRIDSSGNVGIGTSNPSASGGSLNFVLNGTGTIINKVIGSNTARFDQATSTGNSYAINQLVDNSGNPFTQMSRGSAVVTNYDDCNTHYWRTNSGVTKAILASSGSVAIGGTGTDATLHIQQALGGYNRLTQMSPSGTSLNAFNLMAAKNSGGGDSWWSWGVRTDSTWALVPGVDSALTSSTGIYFNSSASAFKPGGGTWSATSDRAVKTNIAPIVDAASRIMALKPSSFDYRAPEAHAGRVTDRGFIAQDFEEVYPHSVSESEMMCDAEKPFFGEGEKIKSVGLNTDFFADLVALVQEQQETIIDLRARVAQLEGN